MTTLAPAVPAAATVAATSATPAAGSKRQPHDQLRVLAGAPVGKSKSGEVPTEQQRSSHTAVLHSLDVEAIAAAASYSIEPPHFLPPTTQSDCTRAFALPRAVARQRCIVEHVVGRTCR
ncbi:hypothetical protein C7974DRAFT_378460 [Boeremia exigua]|uniref:uncharacterized protein n=1 Tax=Boeremia exigua TaxID=749465 RepID=UPI001E8CA29C|nr:uncharacterized protein C7974DRAFT_378460 [Boeremia exigua]KAH6620410.1 hypothetical protein C7974DRAFT_378460 [Boeremia exigua]